MHLTGGQKTWLSQYQKGKKAIHVGVAVASPEPHANHIHILAPTPHHSVILQARCSSCHSANSVKALKASERDITEPPESCLCLLLQEYYRHIIVAVNLMHKYNQQEDYRKILGLQFYM